MGDRVTYTDEERHALWQALRPDPTAARCPRDGSPMTIERCTALRHETGRPTPGQFEGLPPDGWVVARATVICSLCGRRAEV